MVNNTTNINKQIIVCLLILVVLLTITFYCLFINIGGIVDHHFYCLFINIGGIVDHKQ
jgi:hypothetical protein